MARAITRLATLAAAFLNGKSSTLSSSLRVFPRLCHSLQSVVSQPNMRVRLIPALEDNYMYLLIDEHTKQCAVVDPVEPKKILAALEDESDLTLTAVLTTHHHWDHAGGNEKLIEMVGQKPVYGGDDRIGALTKKVKQGDEFKIGDLNVQCLFTPCHTSGHICYYVTGDKEDIPAVFTGDTLFQAGCGKFFEGTAHQMYTALIEILSTLPRNTKVYCGHEYTVSNLKYAVHVEPENRDIARQLQWATEHRSKGESTIPTTINREMEINPFMRVCNESVQKHCKMTDPVKVMDFLRTEKNSFKPPA